jgi:CO/xanthine dehydrogenase FAD-binding subunit
MSVELDVAENLAHALELLSTADPEVRPVAGATDLMLRLGAGRLKARRLISIADVPELSYIHAEADRIRFGAGTLLSDLMGHPEFASEYPCALESLRQFASPQIRNRATVGGNIGNASPAADMVPPLIALGATVTLTSRAGARTLALEDVFQGFGRTVLRPDELVTGLSLPRRRDHFQAFAKFGSRGANVIAVVNLALCLKLDGDRIAEARVAYGSVAPRTLRPTGLEQFLQGKRLSEALAEEVEAVVRSEISPIDDVRGSRRYKERLAVNATQDALVRALSQVRA